MELIFFKDKIHFSGLGDCKMINHFFIKIVYIIDNSIFN